MYDSLPTVSLEIMTKYCDIGEGMEVFRDILGVWCCGSIYQRARYHQYQPFSRWNKRLSVVIRTEGLLLSVAKRRVDNEYESGQLRYSNCQ